MNPDVEHRISKEHRSRDALVYVRQSDPGQVRSYTESARVQRGLRERAIAMGWRHPVVIDEDLGISAGGYAERPGFRRLLAAVAAKEVGIIFCLDASRLSRNSKDWAHLFELCGYFDTLLADLEQVYDLSRSNDRLVMGIKGTVSEMELSILRTRLRSGRDEKAARGELRFNLPTGYVHDTEGRIVIDPDQRVYCAIARMFEQFKTCTSVRQLCLWYRDTKTLFLVKRRGRISWEIPTAKTLPKLLVHPLYAGTYAYGRRVARVDYVEGRLVKGVTGYLPEDQWRVCIYDHHAPYVSREQLLENQAKIHENRPRWDMQQNRGAIREGLALLAGMLRCGQCGARVHVGYKKSSALYFCDGGAGKGSRRCLSFGSRRIDQRVSEELCRVVQPLSIQAALTAETQREQQQAQEVEAARLQLQAAQYEADRAFEQFDLVDPKNRLVADTLEERLNGRLADLHRAKQRLAEVSEGPQTLTDAQKERLQQLSRDFPAVWDHPKADPVLKKQLLRMAIEEILVRSQSEQQQLEVILHWKGGAHSRIEVPQPPPRSTRRVQLLETVRELAREITDAEIARILNLKNMQTPGGLRWTQDRVNNYRRQYHIPVGPKPRENTLTLNQAAEKLGISHNGMRGLVRIGAIQTNQVTDFAPWRIPHSDLESERIRQLVRTLKATGRLPKGGCAENQAGLFDAE